MFSNLQLLMSLYLLNVNTLKALSSGVVGEPVILPENLETLLRIGNSIILDRKSL